MPKLKVDTSTTLYEPLEVEIDGKTFKVRRITRDLLRAISAMDVEVQGGQADLVYDRLALLLEEKAAPAIDKLDLLEVRRVMEFITENAFKVSKEEKNGSRLGDEKSPS